MLSAFNLLRRFRKGRPSSAPSVRFSPRVELLEGREVPTGNVTGAFNANSGTLTLTGVNSNVIPADNDQDFLIAGLGQGSVSVQGQNGTTVNLGGGPVIYNGVKTITVNMNNGNDIVTVQGVEITGNMTVNQGEGSDAFRRYSQWSEALLNLRPDTLIQNFMRGATERPGTQRTSDADKDDETT